MVRKQVYITREQAERLKRAARKRGTSEADLVRSALDLLIGKDVDSGETILNEEERRSAWAKELAFMEERAMLKVPQEPRTWTRDELYDGRPKYLSDRH